MKHIPILMSTPMVQALLEGRKTMTRREVKPQGAILTDEIARSLNVRPLKEENTPVIKCPYGQPGDVLWVRETFVDNGPYYLYKANGDKFYVDENYKPTSNLIKWKPSLFMPKEACRIFLQITNIRVERLQDISADDAVNEGIEGRTGHWKDYLTGGEQSYRGNSFRTLCMGS